MTLVTDQINRWSKDNTVFENLLIKSICELCKIQIGFIRLAL